MKGQQVKLSKYDWLFYDQNVNSKCGIFTTNISMFLCIFHTVRNAINLTALADATLCYRNSQMSFNKNL